jgi:ABC-type transport system involved in cytochrome bd biosynthesis fused ATPase/permease subunit
MLKAFSPVIVLFLLFGSRLEKPTFMLSSAILIISIGTFQSASGEVLFSWTGLFLMLASEFFDALKVVVQQVNTQHLPLFTPWCSPTVP